MMRLGQKVPIEPLDDVRVARLEDQVLVSFRATAGDLTGHRGTSWLESFGRSMQRLSPAIAVAAVIVAVFFAVRGGGPDDPVAGPPARIAAGADGTSTIDLGDAVCTIAAGTAVDFDRRGVGDSRGQKSATKRSIDFALAHGQIDCEVEPRERRAAVVVRAGEVAVTVVGTVFQVRRDDMVHVSVSRGKVRVDVAGESHEVSAGQQWSGPALVAASDAVQESGSRAGGDGGERVAQASGSSVDPADGDASGDASSGGNAASDESGDESGSSDRQDARTVRDRRVVALDTDADGARLHDRRTSRRPDASRSDGRSGGKVKSKNQRGRALRKARPSRGKPSGDAADNAALSEAMGLERRDPEAAIVRYRKLSLQRGPEAEFALYSLAYVHYFIMRDNRSALQSLDHYQRRFARGAHRESALWLRVRILCEGDDTEACRAAAHTYLNRFPRGSHAKMAQNIINWDM